MGSGASSKGTRVTARTAVGAVRWKKNAPSKNSASDVAAPSEEQTPQTDSNKDMEDEGRQLKNNKKSIPQTSTTTTQASSKQGTEKAKLGEAKNTASKPVKPEKSGDKGKLTVNKVMKTSEAKKPARKTVAPEKAACTISDNDQLNVASKSVQLSTGSDLGQKVERVLKGLIEENCPLNSRTIRIFLSSTFTDTEHERNALMEHVYPKLRQFCQKKGYEFQVVDMRWGVRDDATDTHMTTELCLREIKACQEISVGPNFVTLLSEKYGYRPLMPSITTEEFELILSKASDNQIHELLTKWYKEDENCFPVSYILQPVTTWIPNFFNDSCDPSLREEAQKQWESEYNMMREFLLQAAKEVLNEEDIWQKYVTSVSEEEIKQGLLQVGNPKQSCVWFHRAIKGLDSDEDSPEVLKYTDKCLDGVCLADGTHPQALLHNLKNEKMKQAMDTENIFTYDVTWTPNGIDPSLDEHKKYLDQFCKDFENKIKDLISEGISEHKVAETDNLLYSEVVQHTLFCKRKLEVVYGRKSTVEEIEDYVRGPSRYPLVIHGKSGCGKTAVIAMAAKSISELSDQKGCICLRFLGTTPKSSTILRVLKSVMLQIKHVYKLTTKVPRSSKGVFDQFPSFLSSATKDNPLVVILDSLDQLSPLHGAWKLTWFPRKLPLHVKFIVSTLPDQEYKCFPVLKALFKNPKCFVSVPELSSDDVSDILTNWLKSENRTLQDHQLQVLKDAFKMCPLPLFLKISYDETRLWRSYSAVSETCLETTIRKAVDKLLERVEISHGEVLVRRALGYLTAASLGLATNELEDILSCDEDLLHDVFQYWTPPIRRLPPLLWVRIRADLSSYLVDRGADGTQVTCWYHRQFVQAAEDRYLSDAVEKKRLHTHIADYFLGRNFVEEDTKEMTLINGKQVRLASISGQPLLLSKGRYNLRKLHELPIQLIRSQRWDELKREVLCNFEWLSTKIEVRTLRSVLDNFRSAMNAVNDSDIAAVAETLQLAQDAILSDPNQLAAQFVGRLYECKVQDTFHVIPTNLSPVLAKLVQDSRNPPEPALIPSRGFLTPPGGQLVHTLVVNSASVVYGLAATSNGKFVVTGSQEGVVKVWDNGDGSLFLTVPEAGDEIGMIACGCDDDVIIVSSKTGISLISFETGEILQRVEIKFFEGCPPFTLVGEKGSKVVFLKEKGLHVISASSGKFLHQFSGINPVGGVGQNSLLTSWNDTVLCNSKEDENSLKVIDMSDYKILHSIKVFSEKDEEEFLHLTQITMKSENEVLVAKKMKIDLYSVDSGEHLRTYKCKIDDWIRNLSLDPDDGLLVFPKESKVAFLDLESGERRDVLPHPNFVSRVFSVGSDVILTSGGDNVVRVWDLTREDVHRQVEKPETVLNIYSIPGDSRHLVTLGRLGIGNYCVTIWDLATMLPLRKITGITTSYLQIINDRRAAIRVKENVAIVDLHTWKVVNVLKGKIPPYDLLGVDDVCVVNDNTEILTYSHDRKNLMLYDIETGDQVAMLKSGQSQQDIRSFLVNSEGTIVVWNEAKPADQLYVWDLETREQIFIIKREGCERQSMTHAGFTPDGDYFVSSTKEGKKGSHVQFLAVWDMRKKELLHDLRYSNDTDTISVTILDNTRAITAHKDLNIVCWDIEEGTPIHILPSNHFSNLRINIMASKGDVVVSYDEKTLIMWDMRAGAQKATFTADKARQALTKVTAIHPVGEGQCIALGYESVLPLVLLTLQGGDVKPYEFPTEGTKAIAGTDMQIEFKGIKGEIVEEEEDTKVSDGENETVKQREEKEEHGSDCVADRLIEN